MRIFILLIFSLVCISSTAQEIYDQQAGSMKYNTDLEFICTGVNPNWNLSISKGLISLYLEKNRSMFVKTITAVTPVGDSTGNILAYSTVTNDNKPVMILLKRNDLGCINDTSGAKHKYDVYAIFPGKVVTGCCDPRG